MSYSKVREKKNSIAIFARVIWVLADLRSSHVLGYYEFLTNRYLMVDMPTHLGKLDKVPLDGIGATFTLVR